MRGRDPRGPYGAGPCAAGGGGARRGERSRVQRLAGPRGAGRRGAPDADANRAAAGRGAAGARVRLRGRVSLTAGACVVHGRRVLPRFSLPRTPQHNAVTERGMRELEEAGAEGLEGLLDVEQAGSRQEAAGRSTRTPLAASQEPCSTARTRVLATSPPARRSWARSRTMRSSHEPEEPNAVQAEFGRDFV